MTSITRIVYIIVITGLLCSISFFKGSEVGFDMGYKNAWADAIFQGIIKIECKFKPPKCIKN